MTQQQRDTFDRVVLIVVGIVGGFIFLSLLAQFVLVYTGRLGSDESGVWRPIFDLVVVLVGAIGGYITGQRVERVRGQEAAPVAIADEEYEEPGEDDEWDE